MNSPLLHHQQPPMTVPLAQLPKSGTDIERDDVQRKLRRAIMLSITLMGLEIVGGLVSGSLAIVTDAAHLLSDVSGFAVSLFAVALAQKRPSTNYTYGYHQAEILGALTSVLIVWAMTGVLLFEATRRFINLAPVDGRLMLIMAIIGLVVNFALFGTLHQGGHDHSHGGHGHGHGHGHSHAHGSGHAHSESNSHADKHHHHNHGPAAPHVHGGGCSHGHDHHNHAHTPVSASSSSRRLLPTEDMMEAATRGQSNLALDAAVIHIIGDTVQSVGVLLAAILIVWQPFELGYTDEGVSYWYYADPACTIMFSILVMFTTFRTISQSVSVLMHRVPETVDLSDFDTRLREVKGVQCIHDVHVWMVGSTNVISTAHVVVDSCDDCGVVLNECKRIAIEMGIGHSTFQLEVDGLYNHAEETFGDLHSRDEQCCGEGVGV